MTAARPSRLARVLTELRRIRYRLLAVNAFIVLVPAAGLEFARVYERQLLEGLERDMQNQASLVKTQVEAELRGGTFDRAACEDWLESSAKHTRTRVRVLEKDDGVVADSHKHGPPEGREPRPSRYTRDGLRAWMRPETEAFRAPLLERPEMKQAFGGARSAATRVARDAVYLFLAEPVRTPTAVWGAVYVTRSTWPVLQELRRIRRGLTIVLAVALTLGIGVTLLLAWSISRPLERLAFAARRIAEGAPDVELPRSGGGEIAQLSAAFAEMTHKLEQRHRYISEFAADVAHGFKSPLTSIRGAAELLNEGAAEDPAARQRFLGNILLDAARLDRLVTRLLELSRIDAADRLPAIVELAALTRRVVSRFDRPDAPVRLIDQASTQFVFARESDLETALCNLLDNAQRFSPPGAPVELHVLGRAGESHVTFRVVDQGPGVPEAHQFRVFERFFTTDPEGQGTGLGLAIVKSVAEVHGGSVRVVCPPGQGAQFELELPVGLVRRVLARDGAHS